MAEFGRYLWGSDHPPRALHRALGYGIADPESAGPIGRLPRGLIVLYPRYLAFLATPTHPGLPSDRPRLSQPLPLPIGAARYRRLLPAERARLFQPLRTPGSLLVRVRSITELRSTSWRGMPAIELATPAGALRFGPHPDALNLAGRQAIVRFTRWEPQLFSLLRSLTDEPRPGNRHH